MKKRMKMIITSAMLAFSLAMLSFGVFAATTHSLGINNYIMFDIGDNIACDIEPVSAIGTSPSVTFGGTHNNSKTLSISAEMGSASGTFSAVGGNTPLSQNGAWEPWTVGAPAELTMTNDTVYWMFKVTNNSDNAIQVRLTDEEDKTLFTMNNKMQLIKKFGSSNSETPNNTESSYIEKGNSVYVLVSLETKTKNVNISSNWNFKLHIEKANSAYLLTTWKAEIPEEKRELVETINFVTGTETDYSQGAETFYLGATDKDGDVELKDKELANPYVSQIKGYLKGSTLNVYSQGIIHAPVNSSDLFRVEDSDDIVIGFWNLEELNLDNFDTKNVENFERMFNLSCCNDPLVTSLDVSDLDTSNALDMSYMFYNGGELQSLDVSGFDTSNVENMSEMFSGCYKLQSLDVSGFDTSNVENMSSMFEGCNKLQSLDLSSFNTKKVTDMSAMFNNCSALQSLDLSSFYIKDGCDVYYMLNILNSQMTTLKTPYYVANNITIDISTLGFSISTISVNTAGSVGVTLTKN